MTNPVESARHNTRKNRRMNGFTLLEVLVAFMILAVSLGVIMHIFSLSLRTAHSATQQQMAVQLAQSKLSELLAESRIRPGVEQGSFNDEWRWRAEIDAWDFPDQDRITDYRFEPYKISVTVEGEQGTASPVTLTTLFLLEESGL